MNRNFRWLMTLHFLNDGFRTTFVTLLPFIAKDLSLNLSTIGFLGSTQPLLGALLSIPAGFLAARMGGFQLLLSLLLIYSIGSLSLSFSSNTLMVVLAFLLGAIGFGMFHTLGFSLVAKMSDKDNVGKSMGNFTSVGDIGRVAIPPLAVFAIPILGWRQDFVILALVGFVFYLILKNKLSKREILINLSDKTDENHMDFIKGLIVLLKAKKLRLTLLSAILDSLASSPVYIFLPFLLFSKGIQITQYGIIASLFLLGSLAGKYLLGRLIDKIGTLKVFIISEILMAACLVLLIIFSNYYFILILALLLGIFTRGTTPAVQSMFSEVSHKMHYDKIYGLSEMFIGLAAVSIIILMGFVADRAGVILVFYSCAFFAILAAGSALFLFKSNLNQLSTSEIE